MWESQSIDWWWFLACALVGSIMILLLVFLLKPFICVEDKLDFQYEDTMSESSTSDSEVSTPQEVRKIEQTSETKAEIVENTEKRLPEKQAPAKNPLDVW